MPGPISSKIILSVIADHTFRLTARKYIRKFILDTDQNKQTKAEKRRAAGLLIFDPAALFLLFVCPIKREALQITEVYPKLKMICPLSSRQSKKQKKF